MKKILSLLLVVALMLSISACGKKQTGGNDQTSSNGQISSDDQTSSGGQSANKTPVGNTLSADDKKIASVFNENNIVFSFGAVSDIHVDGAYMADSSYVKATTTFKTLQKFAKNGKLDAVLIAGDLVNCTNSLGNVFSDEKYPGTKEENQPKQAKAERDNFKKVVKDSLPDNIALFYSLGNHDSVKNNHTADFIEAFSADGTYDRYFKYDVDMDDTAKGLRHCVIGGYHFFAIDLNSVVGPSYAQESFDWLKVEFDKVLSKDKNANIFLAAHYGPQTAGEYEKEGDFGLKDFLKDYPQVITFHGHNHDFIQKETSIMQHESGYITLNCGSANYFPEKWLTPNLDCVNVDKKTVEQYYGGYLVEIDGEGDIRVRRINFAKGSICADDWVIPAVKNGKRELNYTRERAQKVQKPYFKDDGTFTIKQSSYNLQIIFDAAVCEDYVYYYKVEVFKAGSNELYKKFGISSGLFADRSEGETKNRHLVYTTPLEKGKYTIKVTPYDTFENAGKGKEVTLTVE